MVGDPNYLIFDKLVIMADRWMMIGGRMTCCDGRMTGW